MPRLELTFFGSPQISIDQSPINSRIDKTVALMALLSLQGPTLSRNALITSLWTNCSVPKAQAALRTALWRLKDTELAPWLEIDREFISLQKRETIWIDVEEFRSNIEKTRQPPHDLTSSCHICSPLLRHAVDLYKGDFMAGYSPRNATSFDEWRSRYGQQLSNDYLSALERLVKGYHKQGQYSDAIQMARRWLVLEPYNEEAHSLIIRCYASNNQRTNAIAHYRYFKRLIDKRFNITPTNEITTLYKNILIGSTPLELKATPLKEPALLLLDIGHLPDLWANHGILMEKIVDRFTIIVREGLRKCGGKLIKHTGDSFLVYFDQGQPLSCAIAIQRLVSDTKWGLPSTLSVRMVVTTIPNYSSSYPEYSSELISCRALLYSASENQILITEQALRTLETPVSSRTHNLGSYILPGQVNPTQVYELLHPQDTKIESAGLHNLVRSPVNLPIQATRFVGRENELDQITSLLNRPECRLLTLVGPGGVGKTRLGIQVLSRLQHTESDGMFYIPLVAHQNPQTIYRPIAEVLNLVFNDPGDPAEQLIKHLHSKRSLLLLDNYDHLLDATPYLIQLLGGAPGLRLIITSRERLNLQMETPYEVHGLSYPADPEVHNFEQFSGIKLFIQNAQRVSPGFLLRPEDKPYIIQICNLVDGLPLGIELSSAWVRALSCREIAQSIQQNLDFVHTNSKDVPPRHRSLRAAFNHSWKLLSEEDRRIIAKLSIFKNSFTPHAAEEIANASPVMLASYIDKSMLTRQSINRCLMPDVIRLFIIEHMQSDRPEYERLLSSHSEYYLNLLIKTFVEFARETAASAIRELWLDADNIRMAINWAMDHQDWPLILNAIDPLMSFFELQSRFREGRDNAAAMIKRVTELAGMQQPDIYYSLLGWDGTFSFRLGFSEGGLRKMKARLEYAQTQGDLIHAANTLMLLADAHRRHGDLKTAREEINQSLSIFEPLSTTENPLLLGFYCNSLCILGQIQLRTGELEDARLTTIRCNDLIHRSGSRYVKIRLLELQARIEIEDERYETAFNLRQEALTIAEDFNDRRSIAIILNNLGDSAEQLGDHQSAYNYLVRASQISEEIGDRQISALFHNNLGYSAINLNKFSDGIQHYHKSLNLYREITNRKGYYLTLRDISRAYLLSGNIETSKSYLREALQVGSELNDPFLVIDLLIVFSNYLVDMKQLERAIQLARIVYNHPRSTSDLRQAAKALMTEIHQPVDTVTTQTTVLTQLDLPSFQSLMDELNHLT